MRDKRAADTIAVEGAAPPESTATPDTMGVAPMDEGAAGTEGTCASRADTRRDLLDETRALGTTLVTPDEPEPDVAEDPMLTLSTPRATVETVSAADLAYDAPTRILPAAAAAALAEEETLRQPALAAPRRVPRYSQPLRGNPFFLYRVPDLLRDANDPSLPPPPGMKWAYDRRQVRWYLRSAEEGALASRPWIWVVLLLAGVFVLAILSRLIGG
jgi:hypothetical protein